MALKDRSAQLGSAVLKLEEALDAWSKERRRGTDTASYRQARDSLLLRFVLVAELVWKMAQAALSEIDGINCGSSPKGCCRALYAAGYIGREELRKLLKMVDARNSLVHVYDEEKAENLASEVKGYLETAKAVLFAVAKRLEEVERLERKLESGNEPNL